MHEKQQAHQRPMGGGGPASLRARPRAVDRRGRRGPARLRGAAGVHPGRRHGQPVPAPPAAGRGGRDRGLPGDRRSVALRPLDTVALPPQLVKGRETPVDRIQTGGRTHAAAGDARRKREADMDALVVDEGSQDLRGGERTGAGPARRQPGRPVGGVRRPDGPIGLREVDAAQPGRRPRRRRRGHDHGGRRVGHRAGPRTSCPSCAAATSASSSSSSTSSRA